MQQIQQLEMQKHAIELQNNHDQNKDNLQQNNMQNNFQNNSYNDQSFPPMGGYEPNFNSSNQYGSESGDHYASNNSLSGNENSYDSQTFDQINSQKKKNEKIEEPDLSNLPNINFSQPPPGFIPDNSALLAFQNGLPDLSKPPPGFPPFPEINNEELMPSVPYFELPAGLMVPLIMVCTFNYSLEWRVTNKWSDNLQVCALGISMINMYAIRIVFVLAYLANYLDLRTRRNIISTPFVNHSIPFCSCFIISFLIIFVFILRLF